MQAIPLKTSKPSKTSKSIDKSPHRLRYRQQERLRAHKIKNIMRSSGLSEKAAEKKWEADKAIKHERVTICNPYYLKAMELKGLVTRLRRAGKYATNKKLYTSFC